MRTPGDMPARLPMASRRFRVGALIVVAIVILLVIALRALAGFWTDYLWFQSVGFTSVFRGVLLTKVLLALVFIAIFFLLMLGNLWLADRFAPDFLDANTADELVVRYRDVVAPRGRVVKIVTSGIFALLAGTGANREWNNWDLLRYQTSFGVNDPQFHKDIGFYVFELPFIKFLLGWVFEALVVVLIVTAVAHYLNGGIQVQAPNRRLSTAVKTHISVLLGLLALVKAVDYYFQRYELVLSRNYVVNGATATAVHAELPAKTLLIAIAVIAAGLFLYNIRQKGWILPAVGVALWALVYVLVGAAYPALYQAIRVNPSELTREAPYIARNILATEQAYGLLPNTDVAVHSPTSPQPYTYTPTVTASEIDGDGPAALANQQTLANVRLLDAAAGIGSTFNKYQGLRGYYAFNDLDLDRYTLDGSDGATQETETLTAVRELDGTAGQSGFVNEHLAYTHGYGAVVAPVGQSGVNPDGTPSFALGDLPPSTSQPVLDLTPTGSQIYYGEGETGFVIADSKTPEIDYENPATGLEETTKYAGTGGVRAGNLLRRAAFALRFGDLNFILSGQITASSKVMYIRDIVQRVHKAAPFLKLDSDPYAVVLNGRVYWIVDAYTTTDNYPYSQNAITDRVPPNSGLSSTFNYARNSVKVVVSAYDGSMHFFVVDPDDPIIRVYERAFPDLFTSMNDVDTVDGGALKGIEAHFRYPEDIFRVQTNMYGRYHLTDPSEFYTQDQAWAVSPDPGSGPLSNSSLYSTSVSSNGTVTATVARMPPQYILAHLPGQSTQTFMLITPFVPVAAGPDQQNLTAFMTATSDWDHYGQLNVYEMPPGETVEGPNLISNAIKTNSSISEELTFLDQRGSSVELGEVNVIPIDDTLLYVQSIYVESSSNPVPTLRDVVVVYDGLAFHSGNASLDNALCQVQSPDHSRPFASYCGTPAAQSVVPGSTAPTAPSGRSPVKPSAPAGSAKASVQVLLADAEAEFDAAQTALRAGNLASYQADFNRADAYVAQAATAAKARS